MGEPIWCDIKVRYPETWGERPWFVENLSAALINGFDDTEGPGIWSVHGEGNYGLLDSDVETVLDFLREHRIPFIAHSDTKYEFSADHWIFDGATGVEHSYSGDTERVMLDQDTYNLIVAGDHDQFATVDDYFEQARRTIHDLTVDHLPAEMPEEVEYA